MFANRYFFAVGIPFLLILLGAIARKLIRSTAWARDDFFLGVDLAIAGLSSGLIFISEMVTTKAASAGCTTAVCRQFLATVDGKLLNDTGFLVAALLGFLLVLAIHQDQARNAGSVRKQWLAMGVAGNLIGVALLAYFILAVKGVGP